MRIVLASASPRRRELLTQIGLTFEIMVSEVEEKITTTVPAQVVQELSRQKAEAVLAGLEAEADRESGGGLNMDSEALVVIGADTIVACDGMILGKPADEADAARMLKQLAGRSHEVYTGVTFAYKGKQREIYSFYEATTVHFAPMTDEEIQTYVSTKDPMDKAGSYGIQGFCARYITGIEGDYNNVVGLPVGRVYQELKRFGGDF